MRVYEELVKFFIGTKVLVIGLFRFFVQMYILIYFDNLVQSFSEYSVENVWSKMGSSLTQLFLYLKQAFQINGIKKKSAITHHIILYRRLTYVET